MKTSHICCPEVKADHLQELSGNIPPFPSFPVSLYCASLSSATADLSLSSCLVPDPSALPGVGSSPPEKECGAGSCGAPD